jgi:hypothetical protein
MPTLIPEGPRPTRTLSPQLLFSKYPSRLPGWVVDVHSSHTWKRTFQHLATKALIQTPRKVEVEFLRILAGERSSFLFEFMKRMNPLLELEDYEKKLLFLHKTQVLFPDFLPQDVKRFIHSFEPKIVLQKWWLDKKQLPPKRFVGIGYNDQGTLGTSSWKSWWTPDEDDHPTNLERLKLLST